MNIVKFLGKFLFVSMVSWQMIFTYQFSFNQFPSKRSLSSEKQELVWGENMFQNPSYGELNTSLNSHANSLFSFKARVYGEHGLISKVKEKLLKAEEEEDVGLKPTIADEDYKNILAEAYELKKETQKLVNDKTITKIARVDLVAVYIETVLLALRDSFTVILNYDFRENDKEFSNLRKKRGLFQSFTTALLNKKNQDTKNYLNPKYTYDLLNSFLIEVPEKIVERGSKEEKYLGYSNTEMIPTGIILENSRKDYRKLKFDRLKTLNRDLFAILKAPTSENYMRALKLMTLQTMLQDIELLSNYVGDKTEVDIPKSCTSHLGGNLPEQMSFSKNNEIADYDIIRILAQNGLVQSTSAYDEFHKRSSELKNIIAEPSDYLNHYYNFTNADLSFGGFGDVLPFERANRVRKALNEIDKDIMPYLRVTLDDINDFDSAYPVLLSKIDVKPKMMMGARTPKQRKAKKEAFQKRLKANQEFVSKYFMIQSDSWSIGEGEEKIDVIAQRYPAYLISKMKENNYTYWIELITPEIEDQLYKNKIVINNLPSLNSSEQWVLWSLYELKQKLDEVREKGTYQEKQAFTNACRVSRSSLCGSKNRRKRQGFNSFSKKLENLFTDVLPENDFYHTNLDRKKLEEHWFLLSKIWSNLATQGLLENAQVSEYEFLEGQIESGNPFGLLRLNYLLLKKNKNISKRMLAESGKTLKVDRPLGTFMLEKTLEDKEKADVWSKINEELEGLSRNLFITDSRRGLWDYNKLIELVAHKNLRSKNETYALLNMINSNVLSYDELRNKLDEIWESDLGQYISAHYDLIHFGKENIKDSEKIQKQLDTIHDIYADYGLTSDSDIKDKFILFNHLLKTEILKQIVKDASFKRREMLLTNMKTLCDSRTDDVDYFKEQFYLTVKAQNKINEIAGLQTMPEEVQEKMQKWSKGDIDALIWGGGVGGVALIGAMILTSGCFAATGPFCAPIVAGVLGTASMGGQIMAARVEYNQAQESRRLSRHIENYYRLGLTEKKGIEELKRSYFATGLELFFIIPTIGIMGRGLQVAGRTAYLSGGKKMTKEQFRVLKTQAAREANIKYKSALLGLKTEGSKSTNSLKNFFINLGDEVVGKASTRFTINEINDAFSKQLVNHMGNNPKRLERVFDGYIKRLPKAKMKLEKLSKKEKLGFIGKWRKDNLEKFIAKEADLKKLRNVLIGYQKRGKSLQDFYRKNSAKLASLVPSMPLKLSEIPYYMIQGAPVVGSRLPYLGRMTDGVRIKRLINARNDLAYEYYKKEALKRLGLNDSLKTHSQFKIIEKFQEALKGSMKSLNKAEITRMNKEWGSFKTQIIEAVKSQNKDLSNVQIEKLIFRSSSVEDRAFADALLSSTNLERVIKDSHLPAQAHEAMLKLMAHNHKLNSFEDLTSVLRMSLLNKNLDAWAY